MEDEHRKEIKKKIDSEISKTEELIKDYKELTQPIAPENAIGRLSRMDAINNRSVTEAALRQVEDKLKRLMYIKTKVGQDDFGICAR